MEATFHSHLRSSTQLASADSASWILREAGYDPRTLEHLEALDRSLEAKDVTIGELQSFLVRAGLGGTADDFESTSGWPVWVRNRQVLSTIGTIWDYTDSLERLHALEVPVLAVRGTETTHADAAIVAELAAAARHGRLLVLPGGHASHLENPDGFLAELAGHCGVGAPSAF
jgi:pimeloyl-ACP methyl ester carboxylesterase